MKDSSRLDLLAAILGTLGVLLLLVAAFAAAAQEPQTTERMIVGVADWAEGDRAQSCTRSTSGAGIVDVAAAMIAAAAPAPATAPAMTPVSMTTVSPASAAVIGGGGGGRCTLARDGAPDALLPLLALWAVIAILIRRARERCARNASRA